MQKHFIEAHEVGMVRPMKERLDSVLQLGDRVQGVMVGYIL